MRLSELWLYPVKSMRGHRAVHADVHTEGLGGDRRVMVATNGGQLVTQRQEPKLATVQADARGGRLILSAPGREPISIDLIAGGATRQASLWSYSLPLVDLGPAAAAWISRTIGGGGSILPLLRMPSHRLLYAPRPTGRPGGLSDVSPVHLICSASLADLNVRRAAAGMPPVSMSRFRPNLVVEGCAPYSEDGWDYLRIGGASFLRASRCPRCTVPDVDPSTGTADGAHTGPMRTLRGYRAFAGEGVAFGVYLNPTEPGALREGDAVQVWAEGARAGRGVSRGVVACDVRSSVYRAIVYHLSFLGRVG
jgi:hypothetical protein